MADDTTADDIAQTLADVAPIVAEAAHPDRYELIRFTRQPDGRGGWVDAETVVESGRCRLMVENVGTGERLTAASAVVPSARYTVELPRLSAITTDDTIRINSRTFEVRDVQRPGLFGLFTAADLEERT